MCNSVTCINIDHDSPPFRLHPHRQISPLRLVVPLQLLDIPWGLMGSSPESTHEIPILSTSTIDDNQFHLCDNDDDGDEIIHKPEQLSN